MRRKAIYLIGAMLLVGMTAACQTPGSSHVKDMCGAYRVQDEVGKTYSIDIRRRIEERAKNKWTRLSGANFPSSSDLRRGRITINLNENDKITWIACA